jgi:rhamnulokinase
MAALFGAVDLGATSGRVIAGSFAGGKLSLAEVYRFPNNAVEKSDRLVWDFDQLLTGVKRGLRELGARAERLGLDVTSIGIDTWAVDYGLIAKGELIANPSCYRDPQNEVGVQFVHQSISPEQLYQISGLQYLPFNSIYQIARQQQLDNRLFSSAEKLLMLPDLIGYQLTGKLATERTNASSTGLLDARTRNWSQELADELGIDLNLFPALADAGDELGKLKAGFGPRLKNTKVVLVGSHDTASAVVGVPAKESGFAFISSGTWSLLGAELPEPILTEDSRLANFTNELGVDSRVRYLKNLSGLWLLSESLRHYAERGEDYELVPLLKAAAKLTPTQRIDVNDPRFVAPGDMPIKISQQLLASDQKNFESVSELTAIILHSLAESYAENLLTLEQLTSKSYPIIHVIGGGSQNQLLNQLTANYTGREVLAGPVEATAIGNTLIQLRAAGLVEGSLEDLRTVILDSGFELKSFSPSTEKNSSRTLTHPKK